jgi:hypothetical protein
LQLAAELEQLLDGLPNGEHLEVPPSADVCYCLELFLPRMLRDKYPEWEKESLDGIFVARATKTGVGRAEFVGTCILISDQAVTPFSVELEVAGPRGPVAVLRLSLGEPGTGPLGISGPVANSKDAQRLLACLLDRIDDVTWSYVLEGESQS